MDNKDLLNPRIMGVESDMYALFDYLREHDPVSYVDHSDYLPFWSLSKYDDIKNIGQRNDEFLSAPRTVLVRRATEDMFEAKTGNRNGGENLIHMDRPKHLRMRRVTREWFLPKSIEKLNRQMKDLSTEYVDKMLDRGDECDFVKDIALEFPLRVILAILGIPREDGKMILKITQEMFGSADPDLRREGGLYESLSIIADLHQYFGELIQSRKKNPTSDLSSVIANAKIDGKPMNIVDQINYFIIVATAGHDTTSSALSGGLKALIENPEQMRKLKGNPELDHTASREIMRWVSPVRHMVRTATQDFELRGKNIKAGENIALWFPAANRDESAIENANKFDVSRDPKNHLAFGYGAHMCLGQHLATAEIEIFFRQLLPRLNDIKMHKEPEWIRANFVGGLKSMPVSYHIY